MTVIDLTMRRLEKNPISYGVIFHHDKDGFWIEVSGLDEDQETKDRLAFYMERAATFLRAPSGA